MKQCDNYITDLKNYLEQRLTYEYFDIESKKKWNTIFLDLKSISDQKIFM